MMPEIFGWFFHHCAKTKSLRCGLSLHAAVTKMGTQDEVVIGNHIINIYAKCDRVDLAHQLFAEMSDRNIVTWSGMISGYAQSNKPLLGLQLFCQMQREMVIEHNVRPDDFMYASVLSAAAGLASMRHGKEIHCHLIRTRLDWDVGVGNALVNMYAKCGSVSFGYTIFRQTEIHNLVSWNSMIAAFANHGLAKEAIALFEEMIRTGLEPDSVTFLELLTACNHSGLVNEGQDLFNSMSKFYGITPNVEHLCCLVDLLGRAGRVNEAEEYTDKYSVGDDPVVLGSLLSACQLHADIVVGKRVAKRLIELHPVTSSPHVLLSNLYASNRKWDGVVGARKMLQISGLKKEAAHSVI